MTHSPIINMFVLKSVLSLHFQVKLCVSSTVVTRPWLGGQSSRDTSRFSLRALFIPGISTSPSMFRYTLLMDGQTTGKHISNKIQWKNSLTVKINSDNSDKMFCRKWVEDRICVTHKTRLQTICISHLALCCILT